MNLAQKLEQFGIKSGALKTYKAPRNLFALLKSKDKAELISIICCMIAHRVLPEDGGKKNWRTPRTQNELAQAMGVESRATLTKALSYLRGQARDKAGNLKPGNALIPVLSSRRGGFAECNRYLMEMPSRRVEFFVYRRSSGKAVPRARYTGSYPLNAIEAQIKEVRQKVFKAADQHADKLNKRLGKPDYAIKERELDPDCYYYPTAHDIAADPRLSKLFDNALLFKQSGELDFSGNFDLLPWIWDPALGISRNARLVLSYYNAAGLMTDKNPEGKPKGWIQPKQPTVAKRCGLSVKTVHRAELELAAKGLIRVVGTIEIKDWLPEPQRRENIILFLPLRTMHDAEIRAERHRLYKARKALHEQRKIERQALRKKELERTQLLQIAASRFNLALQACKATRIHRLAVESFRGQTARINAIWAAVERKLLTAGIDRRVISSLVPTVLAPPHPPTQEQIRTLIERSFDKRQAKAT